MAISIHALREEGDLVSVDSPEMRLEFLSTPSARRATFLYFQAANPRLFLSTPSARRATRERQPEVQREGISIHALREEGDHHLDVIIDGAVGFLSTPSARRATSPKRPPGRFI